MNSVSIPADVGGGQYAWLVPENAEIAGLRVTIQTVLSTLQEAIRRSVDGTVPPLFVDLENQRVLVGAVAASSSPGKMEITGNLKILTAGNGLRIAEGSNAKMGTATLVGGSATVTNTSVTADSRIFLMSNADGGTPGFLRVSARTAGTSFTITSSSGTDTSTVAYLLLEPS